MLTCLEVRDVTKTFPGVIANNQVNLNVREGWLIRVGEIQLMYQISALLTVVGIILALRFLKKTKICQNTVRIHTLSHQLPHKW